MSKYRRIVKDKDSSYQTYQVCLVALSMFVVLFILMFLLLVEIDKINLVDISSIIRFIIKFLFVGILLMVFLFIFFYMSREQVSSIVIPKMNKKAQKIANKIRRLFNDKAIVDVLKLVNNTRYGIEMPEVFVYIDNDFYSGYIAIENIASFDMLDRSKMEQKISGILSGKFQKYAVISSELIRGDTYVLYRFEDVQTSMRLELEDTADILGCVSDNKRDIKLAKDLIWHVDKVPHMSIIARTRAGKSVFAGGYLAELMKLQGWIVEYNSAKKDIYVKRFNGKYEPVEIVERAEYWLFEMKKRLHEIDRENVEKYTDLDMVDIAVFFDEIGNLNSFLEKDKDLKKRWENAINALSATGASAGLHIISISQRATKEGFLTGLARTNSSDAVIFLGTAADEAKERQYLISGYEIPRCNYSVGQGIARFDGSGCKWQKPHFYETPLFKHYV